MAPERLQGDVDITNFALMSKTDTWSIGAILYFLLFGDLPFTGSNVSKLVKVVRKAKLKKVDKSLWSPDLMDLWDLISKLLVVDPEARLTAAQALNHSFVQNEL